MTTTQVATSQSNVIELSNKACEALRRLQVGEERFLRITVIPGGCSGMTYEVNLDTVELPFDHVVYQATPIKVVTDGQSLPMLQGLKIDYSDDLVRAGFRFSNPNAAAGCGCGSSFTA